VTHHVLVNDTFRALQIVPEMERLPLLEAIAKETGGRWDLPHSDPDIYNPAIKSISIGGVHAMAENIEDLAQNWLDAAERTLRGAEAA